MNLAPLSDSELVVPTIAQTLDVKEIAGQPRLYLLKAFLREKHLLLLLDNFEQVVGAAVQVADLLAACPNLTIMVTSRMALHVRGEQEYAVPPLAVPDPKRLPDLVELSQYEAVSLFIQRAQAVKPEFQMSNANAPAVAKICVRLDGLPLAIELAAARIKLLSPQALLARLGQRFAVLTGGTQDAPARQQTLRNTIAWSYHLLDAEEQRLFRRLSVFVGGCTLQAIEAMDNTPGDGNGVGQLLNGVASLIDKSLLQQTEQKDGEPRFLMLETIREYGLEMLVATGELQTSCAAHAHFFLALAEQAEPELQGSNQAVWVERLEQEHDNLRAALEWALEQAGDEESKQRKEMALQLGAGLLRFWEVRGHWSEGRDFLERALAGSKGVAVPVQVKALKAAALLAYRQGDTDRAEALWEECLTRCKELGDTAGIALSLRLLGLIAWMRGNFVVACSLTEESLALFREVGDKEGTAWSLHNLASLVGQQGEYTRAFSLAEESLVMHRELGDKEGIAWSLFELADMLFSSQGDPVTVHTLLEEGLALCREMGHKEGITWALSLLIEVFLQQGDTVKARLLLEEDVALSREIGHRHGTAESLFLKGRVATSEGDYAAARALYEESLAIGREMGDNLNIPFYLEGLADVVAFQGERLWATRLWSAAEALRKAMGTPLPPVYRADYDRAVAAARSHLGEKAFADARAEGRMMTPEQALAARELAMKPAPIQSGALLAPPLTRRAAKRAFGGLTEREREVAALIAQGKASREIAEILVVNSRTIEKHIENILSKLGFTSRAQIAVWATEKGLGEKEQGQV